jgi:hypothetical protein
VRALGPCVQSHARASCTQYTVPHACTHSMLHACIYVCACPKCATMACSQTQGRLWALPFLIVLIKNARAPTATGRRSLNYFRTPCTCAVLVLLYRLLCLCSPRHCAGTARALRCVQWLQSYVIVAATAAPGKGAVLKKLLCSTQSSLEN